MALTVSHRARACRSYLQQFAFEEGTALLLLRQKTRCLFRLAAPNGRHRRYRLARPRPCRDALSRRNQRALELCFAEPHVAVRVGTSSSLYRLRGGCRHAGVMYSGDGLRFNCCGRHCLARDRIIQGGLRPLLGHGFGSRFLLAQLGSSAAPICRSILLQNICQTAHGGKVEACSVPRTSLLLPFLPSAAPIIPSSSEKLRASSFPLPPCELSPPPAKAKGQCARPFEQLWTTTRTSSMELNYLK